MGMRFGAQGKGTIRKGKVAVTGTLRRRTVLAASPGGVESSVLAFLPAVDVSIRVK